MSTEGDAISPSTSAEHPALRTDRLGHRYPGATRAALEDVSLEVRRGEILGVLGPNGGGKSTLFQILCTLLPPTSGSARVLGHDVVRDAHAVRRLIGVVFQSASLDAKLSAAENLWHQGRFYGLGGRALRERVEALEAHFGLAEHRRAPTDQLSGGLRRRVELARAVLPRPELLLLDEASTGLDPAARADWGERLRRFRDDEGGTVLLTTHLLDEAERCDRVAVISDGALRAVDTPASLKRLVGGDAVTVEPAAADPGALEALRAEIEQAHAPWPSEGAPRVVARRIHMEHEAAAELVPRLAERFPDRIQRVTVGRPDLEDAFLHLTGKTLSASDAHAQES